eukprot:3323360-Pleurochrysis_carterae.AAC.1
MRDALTAHTPYTILLCLSGLFCMLTEAKGDSESRLRWPSDFHMSRTRPCTSCNHLELQTCCNHLELQTCLDGDGCSGLRALQATGQHAEYLLTLRDLSYFDDFSPSCNALH